MSVPPPPYRIRTQRLVVRCWDPGDASLLKEALALASVVVDLRVTQVVNQTLGVHAVLRDDAFAGS